MVSGVRPYCFRARSAVTLKALFINREPCVQKTKKKIKQNKTNKTVFVPRKIRRIKDLSFN